MTRALSALGQLSRETGGDFSAILDAAIPINGPMQPIHELYLRLPAKESAGQRIVRNMIERPRRHLRVQFDPG